VLLNNSVGNILFLGYGNVDRQDDGLAWHVLLEVARLLGKPIDTSSEEGIFPQGTEIDFYFSLQLVPEMAETIAQYRRVCFIDAHTGRVPEDIHLDEVLPEYQASPFTHHMTPSTLVAIAGSLYNHYPQAVLFSIRGFEFGFDRALSPASAKLVAEASRQIIDWMEQTASVGNDK
jgi:hydrogenase maturation protease